jgi:gamma-glutamylcyclotransferase (GGCT)/AIG2-like uncharacterized protein YtfP
MCADIMSEVTGLACSGEPARLEGYTRHPVMDEDYPGVVPEPGAIVAGVLYRYLDATALGRLDDFEGEMYARVGVSVTVADAVRVDAWCYVVQPDYRPRLLPGEWDFEAFLAGGKARFRARYVGFSERMKS